MTEIHGTLDLARKHYYAPGKYYLSGYLTGDTKKRFADGTFVSTSFVVKEISDGVFKTRNSIYKINSWQNED